MEVRERILCKANELFLRSGFRHVTMDDIARKAGLSKKTIYQSFTNKTEIVDEIVNSVISRSTASCEVNVVVSQDAIDEVLKGLETLNELIGNVNPVILEDLEKFFPSVFLKFHDFKNNFILEKVKANLKRGIKEGLYREEINIDIVARLRVANLFIPFNAEVFPGGKYKIAELERELLEHFLYGIATAKGQTLISAYKEERIKINIYE